MLVVRVLLFVILLSDTEMMSNLHLKKLQKNFSELMLSGKDDIFRWINEEILFINSWLTVIYIIVITTCQIFRWSKKVSLLV